MSAWQGGVRLVQGDESLVGMYLARMQSSIVLFGLPMLVGARFREHRRDAMMLPAPGSMPSPAGYVLAYRQ